MRKAIIIGLIAGIMLSVILAGCAPVEDTTVAQADSRTMFVVLRHERYLDVVCDVETGVLYARSNATYNTGALTLLVNPDGTPRIWEGYQGAIEVIPND